MSDPLAARPVREHGPSPFGRALRDGLAIALAAALAACAAPEPRHPAEQEPVIEPEPWEAGDAERAMAHVLAAEIALRRECPEQALRHYAEAMGLSRDERVVERAVQLAVTGEDEAQMRAAAERWRELAPERAEAYQLLGMLALRRGELDRAEEMLEQALRHGSEAAERAIARMAPLLAHAADPASSLELLDRLDAAHGLGAEPYERLARAAHRSGAHATAVRAGERALEASPDAGEGAVRALLGYVQHAVEADAQDVDAARAVLDWVRESQSARAGRIALVEAVLLAEDGRLEAAEAVYDRALETGADAELELDLRYGRGVVRAQRGDVDGAEADLRRVLEAEPDAPHALNALGYTLADHHRRLDEARRLIERALEQEPDNAAILDSKGWVLYRQGDPEAARPYLERAFEREPDPEIGAHLGEVLWELGERERAREVWREAADHDGDHRVLRETLERYGVELDDA